MNLKLTSLFFILLILGNEIQYTQQANSKYKIDQETADRVEKIMPFLWEQRFVPEIIKLIKTVAPIEAKLYDNPLEGAKSCFEDQGAGAYKTDEFGTPIRVEIPLDHEKIYLNFFEEKYEQGAFSSIETLPNEIRDHIILVNSKYEDIKKIAQANISDLVYRPQKGLIELAKERYKGYGEGFTIIFLLSVIKGEDPIRAAEGAANIMAKSFGYKFIQTTLQTFLENMKIIAEAETKQATFNKHLFETASSLTETFWSPFVSESPFQSLIQSETAKIGTQANLSVHYDRYLHYVSLIPYIPLAKYSYGQVVSTSTGIQSKKQFLINASQLIVDIGLNMKAGSYVATIFTGTSGLVAGIATSVVVSYGVYQFYNFAFESDRQLFLKTISQELSKNFGNFDTALKENDHLYDIFQQVVDHQIKKDNASLWKEFISNMRDQYKRGETCSKIIEESIKGIQEQINEDMDSGLAAFKQIFENMMEQDFLHGQEEQQQQQEQVEGKKDDL